MASTVGTVGPSVHSAYQLTVQQENENGIFFKTNLICTCRRNLSSTTTDSSNIIPCTTVVCCTRQFDHGNTFGGLTLLHSCTSLPLGQSGMVPQLGYAIYTPYVPRCIPGALLLARISCFRCIFIAFSTIVLDARAQNGLNAMLLISFGPCTRKALLVLPKGTAMWMKLGRCRDFTVLIESSLTLGIMLNEIPVRI